MLLHTPGTPPLRAGGCAARGFLCSGKAREPELELPMLSHRACALTGAFPCRNSPHQPSFPCCHMEGVFPAVPELPSCNRALDLNFCPLSSLALHHPSAAWLIIRLQSSLKECICISFPCCLFQHPFSPHLFPFFPLGCCCQ